MKRSIPAGGIDALQAFLAVLDGHTLADLLAPRGGLLRLLNRKRRDAA